MRLATLSEKEIIITLIALSLLLLFAFVFGTLMEKIASTGAWDQTVEDSLKNTLTKYAGRFRG